MSDLAPEALPEGWAWATMGQIGTYHNGRAFKSTEWAEAGMPIIRIQDLTGTPDERHYFAGEAEPQHHVQAGDLLISWSGTLGSFLWNGPPAVLNQHIFKVESGINRRFHHLLAQRCMRQMRDKARGSGLFHITKAVFEQAPVPLPPLAEQERIVAKVESAMQQAQITQAQVEDGFAAVRNMRETSLTDACSGKLTADWRSAHPKIEPASALLERMAAERKARWAEWHSAKKYQEPQRHEETDLGSIPPTWAWATFDECAADITVGHVGTLKGMYVTKGIPFLRSQNVRLLSYSPKGLECISPESHRSMGKSKLMGGELLVTRSGANVGNCCVYPRDAGEANCADLVITRPLSGLLPEYAAIYVCSQDGQARLLEKGTGIAQPHFNIGAMRKKPFPLPPLEEQREIIRCVESALRTAAAMEAQLRSTGEQADGMVQVTLEQAFCGKLIPTEASLARTEKRSYEDAHALLARIKQERAARPAAPRRAKSNRNSILKGRAMKKLIDEVLRASATPLTAEKVFKESGRAENEVEQFFVELRRMEREGRLILSAGPRGETLLSIPTEAPTP